MHLFYYMKDLVVKDNLMTFAIISSHIFPTTALRSAPESTQIVRNSFARSGQIMTQCVDTSQSRKGNNNQQQIETVLIMRKTTLFFHNKDIPYHQSFDELQILFSSSETRLNNPSWWFKVNQTKSAFMITTLAKVNVVVVTFTVSDAAVSTLASKLYLSIQNSPVSFRVQGHCNCSMSQYQCDVIV